MANKRMVYDEWYGEIPATLHRLIKANNVSPSDFQSMEAAGLDHAGMEAAIKRHSQNGNFQVFGFLLDRAGTW